MAPNKQKIVAPKKSGHKAGRPRKSQPATVSSEPLAKPIKLKIRLKKPSNVEDALPPVSAYQFPLSAPPSDDTPETQVAENLTQFHPDGQITRRGGRLRTKVHAPDMVFGSEMDNLITSSATVGKVEEEDDVLMVSSSPAIYSLGTPDYLHAPPLTYDGPVSQDVYDILNTLQASSEIHVDLPNMWNANQIKPYTGAFLNQLYIQCYENQLWNLCDLIADTWVRALQKANKRSQKSKDVRDHMWRQNKALEKRFAEKKKGFKNDVFEFGLDVQDPEFDLPDVTGFNTERLRELYTHTGPKCGARLLWADAMALCGRKMENDIVKRPGVWPKDLFYDVMCTSLRLVGRKLTLKIEEKYEGAWCRYHEHVKHNLPCYRELAWTQKRERGEDEDNGEKAVATTGVKRSAKILSGGAQSQGDAKRVRFDAVEGDAAGGDAREVIDSGDIDAEGESEEEG